MNDISVMSDVSVIMVSYHTGPALWLAIDSVLEQPECRELILVDNANNPGVSARLEILSTRQSRLKIITGHGNAGFAKGCNMGVRASSGAFVLLLNPDSMLSEGGLARALEILQRFPENTLAGCYLLNPDGTEQRGCRRALLTPRNAFFEGLGLKRFAKKDDRVNFHATPMPDTAHEVPAVSGAFMLLSRSFYDRLHGLDEGYFLHMEDMDLCARVHEMGGKVICMPEVRVIHFRSTSESSSRIVERYKTQGFVRYFKKHFGDKYSSIQLTAMSFAIWARYVVKTITEAVDHIFVPPLQAKYEVARIVLLYRLARFGARDNSLSGKTILVTGAAGQTGLCIVGKALARGANVIAVYHRTTVPFLHPNLTWVQQDVSKGPLNHKADCLIHTAGLWLLPQLLPSCAENGIKRVIAFGSTSMLSKTTSKNTFEKETVENLKKAEAECTEFATSHAVALTILRPTMIYGVALDANLTRMADVIRRFGRLVIYGSASGRRHPVQATDLAHASLDIIGNPATFGKFYNLGGSQVMTYRNMVTFLFQYLGKKPRLFRMPFMPQLLNILGKIYQVGYLNGEMALRMNKDLVFDIQDAIRDFGYRPKGYLEGDVEI